MTCTLKTIVFRITTLTALTACCMSLLDDVLPSPVFCGFGAGCDETIHSPYGRLLGIPLPVVGLLAFGTFYCLTFLSDFSIGRLLGVAAVIACISGMALILIQVLAIDQLCPLCLVIDVAAVILGGVQVCIRTRQEQPARLPAPSRWLWGMAGVLAVGSPLVWSLAKPMPPVPEHVKAHWVSGRITVVEVTDFACPYCRENHVALNEAIRRSDVRTKSILLIMPCNQSPSSCRAARAYYYAKMQGKHKEMAQMLLTANDLTADACERMAETLNIDMVQYRQCFAEPAIDTQIEEVTKWFEGSKIPGVPVVWIQSQRLLGLQSPGSFHAALRRAKRDYPNGYQPKADTE